MTDKEMKQHIEWMRFVLGIGMTKHAVSKTPRTDALRKSLAGQPARAPWVQLAEELEGELAHWKGMHELGWAMRDCPVCGAQVAGAAKEEQ